MQWSKPLDIVPHVYSAFHLFQHHHVKCMRMLLQYNSSMLTKHVLSWRGWSDS